jgi:hypothetical protein
VVSVGIKWQRGRSGELDPLLVVRWSASTGNQGVLSLAFTGGHSFVGRTGFERQIW